MAKKKQQEKITVKNIRSSLFRHIHADGVATALTPSGEYINFNFFSQRFNIPAEEIYDADSGELLQTSQDYSIVREYEGSIFLSIEDCQSLIFDLQELVSTMEEGEE